MPDVNIEMSLQLDSTIMSEQNFFLLGVFYSFSNCTCTSSKLMVLITKIFSSQAFNYFLSYLLIKMPTCNSINVKLTQIRKLCNNRKSKSERESNFWQLNCSSFSDFYVYFLTWNLSYVSLKLLVLSSINWNHLKKMSLKQKR